MTIIMLRLLLGKNDIQEKIEEPLVMHMSISWFMLLMEKFLKPFVIELNLMKILQRYIKTPIMTQKGVGVPFQ